MKKPNNNAPMSLRDATTLTGWSRGRLIRLCWQGKMGKLNNRNHWTVTLAELAANNLVGTHISKPTPGFLKSLTTPVASPVSKPGAKPSSPSYPAKATTHHTIFVVDNSGSMAGIANAAEKHLNQVKAEMEAGFVAEGIANRTTLVEFGIMSQFNSVRTVFPAPPRIAINAHGNTPLWDAIGEALNCVRPSESTLILVITDGEENRSVKFSKYSLRQEVQQATRSGFVTVTAAGVGRSFRAAMTGIGIEPGNITGWVASDEGVEAVATVMRHSNTVYTRNIASGETQTSSYYEPVRANLADVNARDLSKLTDRVADFTRLTAVKESAILDMVQGSRGKPAYIVGSAYYQLTKPEKVQPYKQVVLVHQLSGAVYAGAEARHLLGLKDGTAHKVSPGNHADFDVFIQSTSTNRIIPRGAKVMWDKTFKTAMKTTQEMAMVH